MPNTLFVTGPHVEHAQTPVPEEPMEEYCVYLKIREASLGKESSPVMESFLSTPFWFGTDTQGIHGLMRQLFHELERHPIGYLDQARLLLSQLLIYLVRNYKNTGLVPPAPARNNPSDLTSVIIEEYFLYEYRSLSLEELARRLRRSPGRPSGSCWPATANPSSKKRQKPKCLPLPSCFPINPKASLPWRRNWGIPLRSIFPPHSAAITGPVPGNTGSGYSGESIRQIAERQMPPLMVQSIL